jgi:hypothetical protein
MQWLVDDLHLLEDPHTKYALLRSCFPKLSYMLCMVFLKSFDAVMQAALEVILGVPLRLAVENVFKRAEI